MSTRSASGVPTAAMRCTVKEKSRGSFESAARPARGACRAGPRGSAAYHTISGWLWSVGVLAVGEAARSPRPSVASAGTRCRALAMYSRTSGEVSVFASCGEPLHGRRRRALEGDASGRPPSCGRIRSSLPSSSSELGLGQPVGHVQRPQRAQLARDVGVLAGGCASARRGRCRVGAAFLQDAPRVPDVPVVAIQLQLDQLVRRQLLRDRRCTGLSLT